VIALPARGLQKARGGKAQSNTAGRDRPGLAATKLLGIAEQRVGVLVAEVVAHLLGVLCELVGGSCRSLLVLLAQRLTHRAQVRSPFVDLRRCLGGALVELLAQLALHLAGGLVGLVMGLFCHL